MGNLDCILWLNRVAQGCVQMDRAVELVLGSTDAEYQRYMSALGEMVVSASASPADVSEAARRARISVGAPACVILAKSMSRGSMDKVTALRRQDTKKNFGFLMALFEIADRRRRESVCVGQCTHWWHSDLCDPAVEASLRSQWGI
jgi:Family of unknown function (DUF5958)